MLASWIMIEAIAESDNALIGTPARSYKIQAPLDAIECLARHRRESPKG